MTGFRVGIAALVAFLAASGGAAPIDLPTNARQTASRASEYAVYQIPMGPFADGAMPSTAIEGPVQRTTWRLAASDLTPAQLIRPLRTQLSDAGYDIAFECSERDCGGFDFRFAIETLPAPSLYVNIRNYRFLTAIRGDPGDPSEAVTLLASATESAAFIQVITAGTLDPPTNNLPFEPAEPAIQQDLADRLLDEGSVILDGIVFETGSTALGAAANGQMAKLAELLRARPGLRIALVGHTDSTGSLESNIRVSRQRARVVKDRLIDAYGIEEDRVEVGGMGYLAPRASNLTASGRQANRRVEVIVLSEN